MRQSVGAIALIRREADRRTLWLARWNRAWNAFSLVGGHKRSEESFRECIIREVGEELGLVEERDFVVAQQPLSRLQYAAWSERAKEETEYTLELFDVKLDNVALRKLDDCQGVRWLTREEIESKRCTDQTAISETVFFVLSKLGLVGPSER